MAPLCESALKEEADVELWGRLIKDLDFSTKKSTVAKEPVFNPPQRASTPPAQVSKTSRELTPPSVKEIAPPAKKKQSRWSKKKAGDEAPPPVIDLTGDSDVEMTDAKSTFKKKAVQG